MLKLKLQYFGHLMWRANSLEKTLMLGKIEGRRRRVRQMIVGWHHWLNGHEFEQTPGDSEGQGSLARCSPWGCKESDITKRLNDKNPEQGQVQRTLCAVCLVTCVWLLLIPWTAALQASQPMRILQARILQWVAISFSRGSSQPRDPTCVSCISCIGRWILLQRATREAQ